MKGLYYSDSEKDDDDDEEEESLIHSTASGRSRDRFPSSPMQAKSGKSGRKGKKSAAGGKKKRMARFEIEQMLYERGGVLDLDAPAPQSNCARYCGSSRGENKRDVESKRDDQVFWTLSVFLLCIMAGAFVGLKHDTLLSSGTSKNVDSAHKVNSGAFTDTGEYDKFLRVAPKDVPKVKPKHYPSKTSAQSTLSSTGVAATSEKSNEKPETATSASSSTAAEDFVREHQHIEQEHHSDTVLSTLGSYVQDGDGEQQLYYQKDVDVPLFWHIPRSGGTTLQDIFGSCLGLTIANNVGVLDGHNSDESIQTFRYGEGATYVNVDTTSKEGLIRAKKLGLVQSNLADVVVTPYLYESADLFNDLPEETEKKGRCFTILRHPIERAMSVFFYLQSTSEELKFRLMTIEEYAESAYCEENWMVRFLTNKMSDPITEDDLEIAKTILEHKCLVGFLDKLAESMGRFEKYFGWSNINTDGGQQCGREKMITEGDNVHKHPHYEHYSRVWSLLEEKNKYDMKLYDHAEKIFLNQAFLTQG